MHTTTGTAGTGGTSPEPPREPRQAQQGRQAEPGKPADPAPQAQQAKSAQRGHPTESHPGTATASGSPTVRPRLGKQPGTHPGTHQGTPGGTRPGPRFGQETEAHPGTQHRKRPGRRSRNGAQHLAGWLFSTPFLALFATFMALPIAATLAMSFTDFGLRQVTDPFSAEFIGLDNYTRAFQDEAFVRALLNTAYFVVAGVPLTIGLGLAAAVLLNSGIDRLRTLFRVGFYAPVVTSIVAVAVVWRFVLDPADGLIAGLASEVGLGSPDFLGSETLAMPAIIAMAVWRNLGTAMVLFLAGLQTIPTEVREAARLDGASRWGEFRRITVPLLRPTLLYVAVITTIGYLNVFEEPFVMTQGGPSDSTLTVSLAMYREGFNFFHMGYASAMAYVLFAVILGITMLQLRILKDNTS